MFLPYKQASLDALPDSADMGTILLADANRFSRSLVVEKLARHGYRIVETTTVEQTVQAAREGVQAILLDSTLDGMNGWEVLPLLRLADPGGNVPIVLMSVAGRKPAGLPDEAKDLLSRPAKEDPLLGEISRVLSGPGENARILVIEDDEDLSRVIASVFSREGVEVETVHTREAALQACLKFQPHLLVLDIALPDGDGFNVVDWLRKHDSFAGLPLVVYSGRDLAAGERRQLTLGPTHFFTKARVQPQQLEALVLTLLHNSRQMEMTPHIVSADRNA
jgi:CheY-like chemotaxis protein